MSQEIIDLLTEISHDRKTQETDIQADPRFWVIRDYKDVLTPFGYHDKLVLFDNDAVHAYSVEEYLEFVQEQLDEGELDDNSVTVVSDILKAHSAETISESELDLIMTFTNDKQVIKKQYTTSEPFVVPNTFFLTKQEAKTYIKNQSHNLTSKAHTYAMTGLRSPLFHQLIQAIDTLTDDDGNPIKPSEME